jgi:hypothetical protein
MSLINDALKKAQKQRAGETPELSSMPAIGGELAARIAKRAKPLGFDSLIMWIAIGVAALVVLVAGGFLLVHWMNTRAEVPAKPVIAQTVPAPAQNETAAAKPIETTTATTFVIPNAPPRAVVAITAPVELAPVVSEPVPAPAPKVEAPKLPLVLKLEPKAIAYVESLRVAGIRASTTDSKVLMNDRVYREGDIVEHQLGLRLAVITSGALTFEDERGARYTRNF